jgi:hypothetical protein
MMPGLRNKREIIDRLTGQNDPQAQQQAQLQQQQVQLELEKLAGEVAKLRAEAAKTGADAQKIAAETEKAGAETYETYTTAARNVAEAAATGRKVEQDDARILLEAIEEQAQQAQAQQQSNRDTGGSQSGVSSR